MLDSVDLVRVIKQAAMEAVQASAPADLLYGTVASVSPLQVMTEQKLTLRAAQLALAESVTNRPVEVVIEGKTYAGNTVSALQPGDRVLLFRRQEGQQYVIIDRVV